jgi:glycerol-3-phosphate dehydrogenase
MRRDLRALAAREHELLVIGGGIYGAAAAWDATQRGLAVALVERDDFGAGVSWNSLKTIHGGLRHLPHGDVPSLRESVRERRALLRIAPALVRPLGFLVPTRGLGVESRAVLGAGLALNDLLSADRNDGLAEGQRIPRGRVLSRAEALEIVPGLSREGLTGGALWHDAQVTSSERLTLAFVRSAAEGGAHVVNHAAAVGFLQEGRGVVGVRIRDGLQGGEELSVRSRLVLVAAGPGTDPLLSQAGIRRSPTTFLRARNLVFSHPTATTVAVGARSRGRYLFLVPWMERTLVGTAYEPEGGGRTAAYTVREFLTEARAAFPWAGLEERDLTLVHEGLVPGMGGADGLERTARLHDHETEDGVAGLVSALGVKYTTARAVAEKAVDLALRRLGRAPVACRTAETPLPHARLLEGSLAERTRLSVEQEMALTLADLVRRRLDLGTAGPPTVEDTEAVEAEAAAVLGWDAERRRAERTALQRAYANPLLE